MSIYVTKSFLPSIDEYTKYLQDIWRSNQLTNNGSLVKRFRSELSEYLNVKEEGVNIVTNGTLALQLALRALDFDNGEIITTPFTYVATTSAILWEHLTPVFVDIDPTTLNIDPSKIEQAITSKTKAIMPVHVFGNPCDVESIDKIAKRHNLKVIYDSAHAFGVKYKGKSILEYGDISTLSFHATKLFHTIEGGAVYSNNKKFIDRVELAKRFGHNGDTHIQLGINAKANEFQSAMGLCNLKYIDEIIEKRKKKSKYYENYLSNIVEHPIISEGTEYNYSYYPIILKNQKELQKVVKALSANDIFPRRYFYPSLNMLPYLESKYSCPVSEDIAKRILCIPLYDSLDDSTIINICEIINRCLR
ncbi:MAG: DegT/DnrJ/EryC1/StrS family aminotransferase [Candidatus Nomurabacteria bacterium]|nr:MAG: DegT/DnrJ/EryC1/StrS family aminotransferase [Candidatus Nomurabacteria bacterium]